MVPSCGTRRGTLRLWSSIQRRLFTSTSTSTLFQGATAIQGRHACTRTRNWSKTVPVHARLFSSAHPLDVESDDVAHTDSHAADGDDACPSAQPVQVLEGGKAVLIRFPAAAAAASAGAARSTFDAEWLWSNCPSAVLPDSGQRTRTPGQFPGWKIASASIVDAATTLPDSTNSTIAESDDSTVYLPIPPPPPGSAHPILGNNLFRGVVSSPTDTSSQNLLRVDWRCGGGSTQCTYPNTSYFDVGWLQQWRYDKVALARRRRRSEVTMDIAIPNVEHDTDSGLFEVPYEKVVAALLVDKSGETKSRTDCGLFALLRSIFTDGAALVTDVPSTIDDSGPSISPVEVIGKAIGGGRLSHGALYGDIFHVKSIPSAHNIAYTSQHLAPHQDLAYYESPPGIQLLHCVGVSPTLVGGESVLIDCMAAAERLRRLAPDCFRTLTTCPATFVKQRDGACMTYQRPHIVLKEDGSGQDCIDREIVGVNWSPPFEGPLAIRQDLVSSYFRAYAAFEYMLDNSLPVRPVRDHDLLSQAEIHEFASYSVENTWEYQLRPGQMLVFNNKRMLHGRREFAAGDSDTTSRSSVEVGPKPIRHLVGTYTNIDDTLCQYRVLLQEVGEPQIAPIPNVGNGTTSSVP